MLRCWVLLPLGLLLCWSAAGDVKMNFPAAVDTVYAARSGRLFWYGDSPIFALRRAALLRVLDSADFLGINPETCHRREIGQLPETPTDAFAMTRADRVCTDALLSYLNNLMGGAQARTTMASDQISNKFEAADMRSITARILKLMTDAEHGAMEWPSDDAKLKVWVRELALRLARGDSLNAREAAAALNYSRWIGHFHFPAYVEVNVATGTLAYIRGDSVALGMAVVAGKPTTPTPLLATYCYAVTLYPYWTVPHDIAVNELLPKCRRNIKSKTLEGYQVVDHGGKVFELDELDWSKYTKRNFPYTFRQATGCDNALGVIKFELTDTLDIYLHDTNFKNAFLSSSRYFSHGCVRLSNPVALANMLVEQKVDTDFVKACIKGQAPIAMHLKQQVPVFIIYSPATITSGDSVAYGKDVYHKFK
jgi:L,D-transpeptidase YcbB